MTNTESSTTIPILATIPANATSAKATDGAYFPINKLIGTWNSSADEPTGYNVMPVGDESKSLNQFQNIKTRLSLRSCKG